MTEKTLEELKKIAEELYEQGYICGFGTNREIWIEVYAKAMLEITKGAEFTDELLFSCDDRIPKSYNEVH